MQVALPKRVKAVEHTRGSRGREQGKKTQRTQESRKAERNTQFCLVLLCDVGQVT